MPRHIIPALVLGSVAALPAQETNPHVVFLVGKTAEGSDVTVPAFARDIERRLGCKTTVLHAKNDRLPDLAVLDRADLIVLYLQNNRATKVQLARLQKWFDAGKSAIALRTTSHAFKNAKGQNANGWFPKFFGGHFRNQAPDHWGTRSVVAPGAGEHPILRGVPPVAEMGFGGVYIAQPLADNATPILLGRTGDRPAEPIAWTFEYRVDSRVFYTSLGTRANFEQDAFRALLSNAIAWALGQEVPAKGVIALAGVATGAGGSRDLPVPPARKIPSDATVLFAGKDLSGWDHWDPGAEPRGVLPHKKNATSNPTAYDAARWSVAAGSVIARPGFGDIVTRKGYANYEFHVDFLVPEEPDWVPGSFRGASGVYLGGRHEIQISDSFGKPTSKTSCGAIYGFKAPDVNASKKAGTWQTLRVSYQWFKNEKPRLSAWLNGVQIHDNVELPERTLYGYLGLPKGARTLEGGNPGLRYHVGAAESSAKYKMGGGSFTVAVRFRTRRNGTLFSKSPPSGPWAAKAKALFLRGGRLVYDIGWVGAMTSKRKFNDGKWYCAVLSHCDGEARLYVDGSLEAQRKAFTAEDVASHIVKIGAASPNFGGEYRGRIAEAIFANRGLADAEAVSISKLQRLDAKSGGLRQAVLLWKGEKPRPDPDSGKRLPVLAPIRLQADSSRVRFANAWLRPLAEFDHAAVIAGWDAKAFKRGKAFYHAMCVTCHGVDGRKTTNPQARPFATGKLLNGTEPHAIWLTLTKGFKTMPAQTWLTPERRYDVIHYIREEFLENKNYFEVDELYLATLPSGLLTIPRDLGPVRRDYGPALASQLRKEVSTALSVDLGDDVSLSYDLSRMRVADVWKGGFLNLSGTQHYRQRGEGIVSPKGKRIVGLHVWEWEFPAGFGKKPKKRSPAPEDWGEHLGHYVHGDHLVLAYRIGDRTVLETPAAINVEPAVLSQTLHIGPGASQLRLCVGRIEEATRKGLYAWKGTERLGLRGAAGESIALSATEKNGALLAFVATAVAGDTNGLKWQVLGDRLVLVIPPSGTTRVVQVLRGAGAGDAVYASVLGILGKARDAKVVDPETLTHGGPRNFDEILETRGVLGTGSGAYVVDTLTIPETNPWNAWIRTSALAFFDDGRIAVSTYGGDVWIVSGVDDKLERLRWQRFAAGMFEPMGLQIVDGTVYVTCRDRIVRLHDKNADGEADFYESFFADPDVTASFHAFNFDLVRDRAGYFYYSKSGRYTEYDKHGAIIRVSPDGRSGEIFGIGLRTPNGMGILPDGRVFVSDNQGQWVPASKITLVEQGEFHGVFRTAKKEQEDFVRPILWMPQEFDSSSGGQLFVDDERWGPLSGRLLHTSFGKGWLYYLTTQEFSGKMQASAVKLPFQFQAGIMRARVNPKDGQVYVTGLSGWQGPVGGKDGCLQRVRYTGRPARMLLDTFVRPGGLELRFACELAASAHDKARYKIEQWQYRWTKNYGSAHFKISDPKQTGHDKVEIASAKIGADKKSVFLRIPELRPVMQMRVDLDVVAAGGAPIHEQVYLTIHNVPEK